MLRKGNASKTFRFYYKPSISILKWASALSIVEARDREAKRCGGSALNGREDGVEEVRGCGLREVAPEECSKLEVLGRRVGISAMQLLGVGMECRQHR
jgi:hypothetical protein